MADRGTDTIQLAPRWTQVHRSSDLVVVAAEEEVRLIQDSLIADIIEGLARTSALSEIERALGQRYPVTRIRAAIQQMCDERLLAPLSATEAHAAAWWDSFGCAPPRGEIAFEPLCATGAELIAQALRANGLILSSAAPFRLVTVDDYLNPELARINHDDRPWMLAKPVGHTIWIGPIFIPGKVGCWECLASWLKPHRWPQAAFSGWEGTAYPAQPATAFLPTTVGLGAGMIATAACAWIAQGRYPDLESAVLLFDTRTLRQSRSVLRHRPGCPRCKAPAHLPPSSLREFVSPITGVVAQMDVTAEPELGLYHARGFLSAPLPRRHRRNLPWNLYCAGKGVTREAAETVCVAEGLERYSIIYQGTEQVRRGRVDEVEGTPPNDILLFSEAQYSHREEWNRTQSQIQWVPEPFDPDEETEWVDAVALDTGRRQPVAASLCYMYYDFGEGRKFCSGDTNGCAAGATRTEALLSALLELIERDSVAIWWYNRVQRPAADWSAFCGSEFRKLRDGFAALDRPAYLLDITTDIGIPAYAAIVPRADGSQPFFAAAASVSPYQAARKALMEAAQIYHSVQRRASEETDFLVWSRGANLENSPHLRPAGIVSPSRAPEGAASPEAELELCVRRLIANRIEPLFVDLTRPEIGLPVMRILAPGLRHFWARFAPGRLYSVPVKMGWLDRPNQERELNPTPCML